MSLNKWILKVNPTVETRCVLLFWRGNVYKSRQCQTWQDRKPSQMCRAVQPHCRFQSSPPKKKNVKSEDAGNKMSCYAFSEGRRSLWRPQNWCHHQALMCQKNRSTVGKACRDVGASGCKALVCESHTQIQQLTDKQQGLLCVKCLRK